MYAEAIIAQGIKSVFDVGAGMNGYGDMAGNDDERSGPFKKHVSDAALLEYIETEEVVTTREVAEHFEYHLQTARRRLKQLHEENRVAKKDVGKRFVWWISETQ